MNEIEKTKIEQTLNTVYDLLGELNSAENNLKSARTWGIFDMFGGGFITDLIKHSKIDNAKNAMDRVNFLMEKLRSQITQLRQGDYTMNVNTWLTVADFLFDGMFVDIYMFSKIMQSLDEVRKLKYRIESLRDELLAQLR
ncbi:hypothetical protein [Treponema sp.]|uniref:hypothetical protein n=1 Tax=Treponema sp. TaxID=166 RepID=UPI00298DE44D|nr:hypothetical protein [Treponema sp.]MCR5612680.1 hypothetical protein [Treponema sp.]